MSCSGSQSWHASVSVSKAPLHHATATATLQLASKQTHLQATNAGWAGVRLEHDLDVLEHLLTNRPGPGHLIGHLLGSFLQLGEEGDRLLLNAEGLNLRGSEKGSHSPAANARLAACIRTQPGPHQSWPGPPSPPRSNTPPGCNAA